MNNGPHNYHVPVEHEDKNNTGTAVNVTDATAPLNDQIKSLIESGSVVLMMKGIPDAPQCGFSANVVGLLNHINVKFNAFNILSDQDLRQGIKDYSNWPTYPQLYKNGTLVGGNDIIMELYESGELETTLNA